MSEIEKSEREKIRDQFTRRASQAPLVDLFSASSLRIWDEYVDEMRAIEDQLRQAGVDL